MRVRSTRVVYENRWMRVHEDRTEHPDGSPGLYSWVEKPPAALIVALDESHTWLVEEFRHPLQARFWEFPQGTGDLAGWRATGLEPGEQALEPTEHSLVARRFTHEEVERMIRANEIQDASSVAAWSLATR